MSDLRDRIKLISDEVRGLHPLLDQIFHKLPTIISVDYTHGTNELGADFVLTKVSEELGDSEYIGVIVKRGKITQKIENIEQQIKECSLRRIQPNGRKEIHISEIWVVCNGTISNNAKEKIYNAYRTSNIKFVDLNKLTDLATKYYPEYGLAIGVQEQRYLNETKEQCGIRDRKFSLLPPGKETTYIEQDIVQINTEFDRPKKISDPKSFIKSQPLTIIEAQMGGGKSKLVNSMISFYSEIETFKTEKVIPFYVDCNRYLSDYNGLTSIKESLEEAFKFSSNKNLKTIIFIDGIDEIKLNNEELAELLDAIHDEACKDPSINVVVTCRNISNDAIESRDYYRQGAIRVSPLKLNGVIRFIENMCDSLDGRGRLIEDLKKSDLFKVLPRTPIAAIILGRLISEGKDELPMNLTELYSKYCELTLGRWDIDKGLSSYKQYEALESIVSRLAQYMLNNQLREISTSEAKDIFSSYLDKRNLELDRDKLFDELIDRSGLIIEDQNSKTVSFRHRSFAEFYFAKYLDKLSNVDISSEIFTPYWSNSYFFYIGLKKDCPELIQSICNLHEESAGFEINKIFNMGQFLLAGYQSPYNVVEESIEKIFCMLGTFYKKISAEDSQNPLSKLPPMYSLALLFSIIDHSYGYKFFKKSLLATKSKLLREKSTEDEKAFSLFLLESALISTGEKPSFDPLIDKFNGRLPLTVQLAIGAEALQNDAKTPAIKKMSKKIIKHAKSSPTFKNHLLDQYNKGADGTKLPQGGKNKLLKLYDE